MLACLCPVWHRGCSIKNKLKIFPQEDNTMKKVATSLGILLLVAVFAIPAFGRGPGWGSGWGHGYCINQGYGGGQGGPMAGYGAPGLNLTEEQSAKIRSLREAYQKDVIPLRSELFAKRAELRALWAQTNPDKGAILAKQKEISTLRDQMREKKTIHRLEKRAVLTPEQQASLTFMGRGKRMGPRGDFGYGKRGGFSPRGGHGYDQRYHHGPMGW
jgi:zinc resistance-associated protein